MEKRKSVFLASFFFLMLMMCTVLLIAAPHATADDLSDELIKNSSGVWLDTRIPVRYTIDNTFSGPEKDAINNAFNTWEKANSRMKFEKINYNGQTLLADPVSVTAPSTISDVVLVTKKTLKELPPYYKSDPTGLGGCPSAQAFPMIKSKQIFGGSIILVPAPRKGYVAGVCSPFPYSWSTSNSLPNRAIDLESTMLHEIGHLIGLMHPNKLESSTIMGNIVVNNIHRTLGQADIDAIRRLYPYSGNNSPIAEAAVSKSSGGPYYGYSNPLTVTRGQSVSLYFFADKDVNGDNKASLAPDGWRKVEWNTDLNQGTPTFEKVINNPANAGAAKIGPITYTFNDAPGTYEYQVLKITDNKGVQSNVSKIRITVVDSHTPGNNPPIAEAAVSKSSSGGPYYGYSNPLTVTKGQSVRLYFFADKDVNGDNKASLAPNGWRKVEWNTDLNQGTPTFEKVITNPANAGAAKIGPITYTFNDAPGTYEYQVLKITDKKGAQSNVSKIKITVVASSNPTQTTDPDAKTGLPTCQRYGTHCGAGAGLDDPYQCTTYVKQNAKWVGSIGTYLNEKKNNMNCKKPNIGAPGSVVVMSLGSYGHVGLVRKVNNNTITITDRNLCCDGQDRQYDISVNDSMIAGYIVKDKNQDCLSSGSSGHTPIPLPVKPCPSGNGLYCGDSGKGLNTGYLYQCTNGSYSVKSICKDGCQKNAVGKDDSCKTSPSPAPTPTPAPIKPCPSGNGLYCGDSGKGLNTGYLYQCTNGSYSLKSTCSNNGCQKNAAGKDDSCKTAPSPAPSPAPIKSCPSGNGLYCGDSGKGQNTNSLYRCTNGSYLIEKSCGNGCQKNAVGKDDSCKTSPSPAPTPTPAPIKPCPSGNGLYCGDSGKGLNTGYLYQCTNGSYSLKSTCSNNGCQKNAAGKDDSCKSTPAPTPTPAPALPPVKSCPSGNGLYCGDGDLGQKKDNLYRCTNGNYSKEKECDNGCQKNAAGKNDECKASKPKKCPSGNGFYCGDKDLDQNKDNLYKCTNGDYDKVEKCKKGCKKNAAGKNDECK